MTKQEIDAFTAVVQYGSISAAAGRLYITQPALSRRIRNLETELGYTLFLREKGTRAISLTPQGKAFMRVAQRWNTVYREAEAIRDLDVKPILQLAAIGSVTSDILPAVFGAVVREDCPYDLSYHSCHSWEAYSLIESGFSDIALIDYIRGTDSRAAGTVLSFPVYATPFVLAGGEAWDGIVSVHPSELDGRKEIVLPWNEEFTRWHERWFAPGTIPKASFDSSVPLASVLRGGLYAIVPRTVGAALAAASEAVHIAALRDGPPEEIIYCLTTEEAMQRPETEHFISLLKTCLCGMDGVECYLKE